MKLEIIYHDASLGIERMPVDGGWMYITRYWDSEGGGLSISTTFVPFYSKSEHESNG